MNYQVKPDSREEKAEKLLSEIRHDTDINYWWFGINNVKARNKSSCHVIYSEIEDFLTGQRNEFLWKYGGATYSKKFYHQMGVRDKIVLWMGHGWLESWGIVGFAYISDIKTVGEETNYVIKESYIPENPLTPYPKNDPHEIENTIFLRDTFGVNFYALKDVFYQVKYVNKRTTPVTVDKMTSYQYSALLEKLTGNSIIKNSIKKTSLLVQSKNAHSSGAINYLSEITNKSIQQPIYTKNNNEKRVQELQKELENEILKSKEDSSEVRLARLSKANKNPMLFSVITTFYKLNPDVIVEVLKRANGVCERCKKTAPFIRKSDNTPYLEVHHIIALSDGGEDTVENTIALCPNCHRELHFGKWF